MATLSYPAASLDASKAKLTVRHRQKDKRSSPKDLKFEFFSDQRSGIKPYTNKQITIYRPKGYDASAIYEFVYEAKDPKVMGLAFASVRLVFLERVSYNLYSLPNSVLTKYSWRIILACESFLSRVSEVICLTNSSKRIPELAKGLGRAIREMNDASNDIKKEILDSASSIQDDLGLDK